MADPRSLPPRRGTYRMGVFGSACDPPHVGHVALVEAATRHLGLDRVLVVPTGRPPHRAPAHAPARERVRLAVRAFADRDHVAVDDLEVRRAIEEDGPTYMVDTLEELVERPRELGFDDLDVSAWLLLGADQLASLPRWHQPERILQLTAIAAVVRPGASQTDRNHPEAASRAWIERRAGRLEPVPFEPVEASSTAARRAAASGDRDALARLVPAPIVDDVLRLYGHVGAP